MRLGGPRNERDRGAVSNIMKNILTETLCLPITNQRVQYPINGHFDNIDKIKLLIPVKLTRGNDTRELITGIDHVVFNHGGYHTAAIRRSIIQTNCFLLRRRL